MIKRAINYFSVGEIMLWVFSVVLIFVAFLLNDIYGFVNWQKMKKRQSITVDNEVSND